MREVLSELNAWTKAREQIALATVVETWGSSPRPLGSKMVVTRSGKMAGSVSNGCIEGAVFEEAQKVLKSREPKLAAFGVADDLAFSVGLACGGHIEVFIQALSAEHLRLIGLMDENRPATLRTNLVTGAAVIPVTINGTRAVLPMHSWHVRPGGVEMVLHAPIETAGMKSDAAEALAERVRAVIAADFDEAAACER